MCRSRNVIFCFRKCLSTRNKITSIAIGSLLPCPYAPPGLYARTLCSFVHRVGVSPIWSSSLSRVPTLNYAGAAEQSRGRYRVPLWLALLSILPPPMFVIVAITSNHWSGFFPITGNDRERLIGILWIAVAIVSAA